MKCPYCKNMMYTKREKEYKHPWNLAMHVQARHTYVSSRQIRLGVLKVEK